MKAYPSFDGLCLYDMNLVDCNNSDVYNRHLTVKINRKKDKKPAGCSPLNYFLINLNSLFARSNWTDIEFAGEVDPEHKTIAEVYAPRTLRTIFITCPNPFLIIAKNRVYV